MTILHANILDADRHEPKGISTATIGSVYVADGSGSGSWENMLINYTASLSPAIVAANTTAEQTFTVSGVTTSDTCISVVKPTAQAGLGIVGWRITATDTIGIVFSNNTGSGITPTATQTYIFTVLKA
jgi:hypothetical protein